MVYNSDINAVSVCVVATSHYAGSSYYVADGALATFSNKCGKASSYCIAAPGDYLYSLTDSVSSYTFNSGTSMAAPMVSGGLALIKQEFSSLTNAQVVDRL